MSFAIGVDGGGTKVRALIVDAEGVEQGRSECPGAVVTAGEPEDAAGAVRAAVIRAAQEAGVTLPAATMWAGLAGAGNEVARSGAERLLDDGSLASRVAVGTDVEAAFHDAFGDGPGILLISGTGSIAWARGPEGTVRQVGGWGQYLGDEGSGYSIGAEALRRIMWAEDGRIGETSMRDTLLQGCGVLGIDELIVWRDTASKAQIASLAPLVVRWADEGDEAASQIIDGAVGALTSHVWAALESPTPRDPSLPLVLWGGLLAEDGPLRSRVVEAFRGTSVRIAERKLDPAMGAARMALSTLG